MILSKNQNLFRTVNNTELEEPRKELKIRLVNLWDKLILYFPEHNAGQKLRDSPEISAHNYGIC